MVVAEVIFKVEGGVVEEKEMKHEKDNVMSIEEDLKQPSSKVEWSDNEKDETEVKSDMAIDSDVNSKDIVKTEVVNSALLPSSPPHSPSKAETVESDQYRSSSSRQASVHADTPLNGSKKIGSGPTQSARHLPRGENKALKTFETLKGNVYQNSKVGRSRGYEKEGMVCDCRYRHGIDAETMACTEEAECINRLTQVECLKSECQCGQHCQNQRFQRGQYANLEVIETEKKGFGLRAGDEISADQFVYEYIGEVVEQKEFMKRMQEYRDEGIRHFYFMMLQREEFLDATRKGGIARFVNHSCNPNCYVSKWHVGKYMRMGIFAKRDIEVGEELTFNYNVDRYGNDAQPCYCGEPNCVGSIGGKTQTDIGGMSQLFIDALGIADQVDQIEAKGTRKKKSRHLDEDFIPQLKPIEEEAEIAKVITAVRQASSNRNILQKLLSRIHMTQDVKVQRSLVRLHGFVLIAGILEEWKSDKEIILLAMGSLARWPLSAKNKVVDSGVDRLVQDLSEQEDAEISSLAKDLLSAWETLEMSYRIARKEASAVTNSVSPGVSIAPRKGKREDTDYLQASNFRELDEDKVKKLDSRRQLEDQAPNSVSNRLEAVAPLSRHLSHTERARSGFYETESRPRMYQDSPSTPITPDEHRTIPTRASARSVPYSADLHIPSSGPRPMKKARLIPPPTSIEEIIRKANELDALQRRQAEEAAATVAKAEQEQRAKAEEAARMDSKSKLSSSKASHDGSKSPAFNFEEPASDEADRRLKKLVGDLVVKYMSRYRDDLAKDTFKKYARQLTHTICDKEKRISQTWPPKDGLANGFSKEKTKKIKEFALEYIKKLVARKGMRKGKSSEEEASNFNVIVPVTPPRPESHSNDQPQLDLRDLDDNSMHGDNQTSLDQSNTPVSHSTHSTNGAKGSDRTETSLDEERTSSNNNKQG